MRRGTLGTENLNRRLQEVLNAGYTASAPHPLEKARFGARPHKQTSRFGDQAATVGGFRVGDKVMQGPKQLRL